MIPFRLQQIMDMLLPYRSAVDIGTDHALLPCSLAQHPFWSGEKIIGTDLAWEPLEQGQENINRRDLDKKIELRQGWGFDPIGEGEVDQAIISGLGGRKIAEIIKKSGRETKGIKHFFLQPHRDVFFIRKWLVLRGWAIVNEEIGKEKGNFYLAIRFDPAIEERQYFDWELEIGPVLIAKKPPLLSDYLEEKVQEFNTILEKIRGRKPGHPQEELWERKIELYKGVRQWLFLQKN